MGKFNSGTSLIGLLVAMLIMVLILGTANSLFVFGIKTYQLTTNKLEVQENLRQAMNRLSREVRQATEITLIDQTGSGRLTFKDPAGNVINYRIGISGDTEAAHQLIRSSNGYGHNPVARYINGLYVEPENAGAHVRMVQIKLTGQKGNTGIMEVSTAVTLRN